MLKDDIKHREFTGKVFTSAGIGSGYFERNDWKNNVYKRGETKETYVYRNGTRAMMPRYYRDKIYTETEKEYLWIEKLDKGITWVMGQKCKIDSKEYEEALKYYQLRARQLHGGTYRDWETDRKSTRLNSSHSAKSRMPSSA